MNPFDMDMEVLRRFGAFRAALQTLAGAGGADGARAALTSLKNRADHIGLDLGSAWEGLESVLAQTPESDADANAVRERLGPVLTALDPILSGDAEAPALEALATAVAALGNKEAPTPASKGSEDQTEAESLNSVAAYLIQMEPTLQESLETLRERLVRTVDSWSGSEAARRQLAEALAELDAVATNKRSAKARRVEVVQRVGEVIEIAMHEEEDGVPLVYELPELPSGPVAKPEVPTPPQPPVSTAAEIPAAEQPSPPMSTPTPFTLGGPTRPASLDSDPQLVSEFVAEGLDYLDQAEEALLTLEANPGDKESVNVTFRAFHTIKGVSAFLELTQVSSIAHEAETLLAQVREGSLSFTGTAAELFLRCADVLRGLLEGIREVLAGGTAATPPGLDQVLKALSDPQLADKVAKNESLGFQKGPQGDAGGVAQGNEVDGVARANEAGGATTAKGESASGGDDSVRIRTERLDALVDLVGELVVSYSMVAQDPEVIKNRGTLQKKVSQASKIIRELQDLSTSLRMVPLKPAFHKISRVVRDVAKKSGKHVSLVTIGDDTELDRSMVGVITDPLVHMVRNSVDHGIESAAERKAAGKPEHGTVRLTAQQTGGSVVVTIEDDGKGLDRDKLLAKAKERGLLEGDKTLTDSEIFNLVFLPGLSTAAKVTDISGRGVGMDVVKRAVESLRGRIEIASEPGKGTKFSIHLPLTLAITDGMLVRIGTERYIVPTMKIQVSLRPTEKDIWTVSGRGEMVMLHGQLIPVARLHRLFALQGGIEDPTQALLVVVGDGSRKTALLVDELLGQQQFVVKPLTGQVAQTPGVAGGAILGDGGVGLILDPEELIELARGSRSKTPAEAA